MRVIAGGRRGLSTKHERLFRPEETGLDEAGIGIASATVDVVGLPAVRVQTEEAPPAGA